VCGGVRMVFSKGKNTKQNKTKKKNSGNPTTNLDRDFFKKKKKKKGKFDLI
jgi:hypothetical protein